MKRILIVVSFMLFGCAGTDDVPQPFDNYKSPETEVTFSNDPYDDDKKEPVPDLNMPIITEGTPDDSPVEEISEVLPERRDLEEEAREERRAVEEEEEEESVEEETEDPFEEEEVVVENVSEEAQKKIDNLRVAIFAGLDVGRAVYLEEVSLRLQNLGFITDYEGAFSPEWTIIESEDCPFIKYYDNTPDINESLCEYLLDAAKVSVYSELIDILDSLPLPEEIEEQYVEEALFWFEQGAISGIEENRVLIRNDIKLKNICNNQAPTVTESAHDKGIIEGRKHFINNFNSWLDKNGYIPDYPEMSVPIEVCNADVSMLDPARKDALKSISSALEENPLCEDFDSPATYEMQAQYAQANIDYSKALKDGIESEYSLAAVKVFKIVPCNVSDPLILDLNNNGVFDITSINNGVNFDLHTLGRKQAVAWTNGDGFLFLDRNGNGIVDSGLEFFGNFLEFKDGFEHLEFYDDNKDGYVSAKDEKYKDIHIWNDFNSNGVCTSNEVSSLEEYGIHALVTAKTKYNSMTPGGEIKYISHALIGDSSAMLVGDAFLRNAFYAKLER
jgi:hypothetical protein